MPMSGYRVEWIINRLRRWRGLVAMVERRRKASPDRVELSEEGSAAQHALEGGLRFEAFPPEEPPGHWPAQLADPTVYPPSVSYELERRAGSLMRPKYPPEPPPAGIPKMRRVEEDS